MLKKQKILIIVMASVFLALALLYFIVLSPLMKKKEAESNPTVEPPTLLSGEALDEDGQTILIFPYAERKQMKSIEVVNEYGSFTCYRSEEDDNFYFKDHEQAPLTSETLSSLVVAAGYTGTIRRVTENCDDWATYGLAEENSPAYYKLTLLDGTVHTLYIGDLIKSGGGYYCRYEGRNALYVVPNSIESTLLVPIETLVTPYLGLLLDSQSYATTDEVILLKNGETFVYITYNKDVANSGQAVYSVYNMHYPGDYAVDDTMYSEMLVSFCTLQGVATVKLGGTDKLLHEDEEIMAQYGFEDMNNAPYELYYKYGTSDSLIIFAPSGIEGYYFAYSYLYNLIALVEATSVPYLEWDLRDFISDQIFHESINEVHNIDITGTIYEGDGKTVKSEVHESFELLDSEANLKVTPSYTGKTFSADLLRNFKQFYMVMLSIDIQGYMRGEGIDDYSKLEEIACMKITMDDQSVIEYKFYSYSGRRCYVTINGSGEFYVNKTDVYKMLSDATRAARGLTVDKNLEYSESAQ